MISFTKALPESLGGDRLWVTPKSYRRYWTHRLEQIHGDVFAAVQRWVQPGDVVWDVGANVGVFALPAARMAGPTGRVIAFEADVEMAMLLQRSVGQRRSGAAEILIVAAAVADLSGAIGFSISSYRTAASSIEGFGRFSVKGRTRHCPAFRIDDFAAWHESPAVLKIDVEGAENLVLRGAMETLRRERPIVLCECSGGKTGEETANLLREAGYAWRPWLSDEAFTTETIPEGDIAAVPTEEVCAFVRS
jgi:FkbM family methyltransferase